MSHGEDKPIWLILPNSEMISETETVLKNDPNLFNMCQLYMANSYNAIPYAKNGIQQGAKIFISRGGTAELLKDIKGIDIVIEIKPNMPSIMRTYNELCHNYGQGNVFLMASSAFFPTKLQREDVDKTEDIIQIIDGKASNYCPDVPTLSAYIKKIIYLNRLWLSLAIRVLA